MSSTLTLKSFKLHTEKLNNKGQLVNQYAPFQNTLDSYSCISECSTKFDPNNPGLNFDLAHPVDMMVQNAYDGGVNLILNDGINTPKIVNSRFSVQEDNTFKITNHVGFKDTNLYDYSNLRSQASLIPYVKGILRINYKGILDNAGVLKNGIYIFYFKYSDADGNMTQIQGESGLVYCHMGQTNSPGAIRFGLENEQTDKAVQFSLSNIDAAYDRVFVYFARIYGNESGHGTELYKILTPYTVKNGGVCDIVVTGSESQVQVSSDELQVNYADLGNAKTQASFMGMLLLGNIESTEHDWDALKEASWRIYPTIHQLPSGEVGSLSQLYEDNSTYRDETVKCGYYNTQNLYHRVGYWPEEIYRFGIVYIFEDGSLSPVLDTLGVDYVLRDKKHLKLGNVEPKDTFNLVQVDGQETYEKRIYEPENGQFTQTLNSKGVIRLPNMSNFDYIDGVLTPRPIYIQFHLDVVTGNLNQSDQHLKQFWKDHKIKGFFFVRQKRIPNIICQGLILKQTDKERGALPCLAANNKILGQSFLDSDRFISHDGYIAIKDEFSPQAMLAPDAILQTPIYNDIFTSGKFNLKPICTFSTPHYNTGDYYFKYGSSINSDQQQFTSDMRIISVPDGASMLTNGTDYFSAIAGNPSEASKTSDLMYKWDHTEPSKLSTSTTVVRGLWGSYAGLEHSDILEYGQLCNVYSAGRSKEDKWLDNTMRAIKYNNDAYYAVCDWQDVEQSTNVINCFRGDCFVSMYTHRMFRNFIDESYPTNTDIVDISSWKKNYAVRCTAYSTLSATGAAFSNCKKENEGWRLNIVDDNVDTSQRMYNQIAEKFVLDVKKLSDITDYDISDDILRYKIDGIEQTFKYVNGSWVPSKEDQIDQKPVFMTEIPYAEGSSWWKHTFLQEPDPPKETGFALIDYATTMARINMHEYVERRVRNINRSDLNAVGLGQWVTFPICSNLNIAMRDIDFKQATEEAIFNEKRAFFPYRQKNKFSKLPDSYCINQALKNTVPVQQYFHLPEYTYFKQEYFNRIYYSLIDNAGTNANEWKQLLSTNYVDYPKEYGTITKIIDNGNNVYIIFEHGIGSIQATVTESGDVGLGPLQIIDSTYGSMWKDSIIVTDVGIFGVDTVAKAIWKLAGQQVDIISTKTINKFLIDNIDLTEATKFPYIGHINVKSHYNKNKQDVIFTYYNDIPYILPADSNIVRVDELNRGIDSDGNVVTYPIDESDENSERKEIIITPFESTWDSTAKAFTKLSDQARIFWKKGTRWSVCYNLEMGQFTTFYDWIPLESSNIDNIFFSFDRDAVDDFKLYENEIVDLAAQDPSFKSSNVNIHSIDPAFVKLTKKYESSGEFSIKLKGEIYNAFSCYVRLLDNNPVVFNIVKNTGQILTTFTINPNNNQWIFIYFPFLDGTEEIKKVSDGGTVEFCDFRLIYTSDPLSKTLQTFCPDSDGIFPLESYKFRAIGNYMNLWKHGQAGIYDNQEKIRPTYWYGKQHEFNFEFVINDSPAYQKVFNNLKILSNKTAPDKFEYEIVGEGYEWFEYKPIVEWVNKKAEEEYYKSPDQYKDLDDCRDTIFSWLLNQTSRQIGSVYPDFPKLFDQDRVIHKLPYLKMKHTDKKGTPERPHYKWDGGTDYWGGKPYDKTNQQYTYNCAEPCLVEDDQLNETRIRTEQLGNDMRKYGRVRGNMQYLEDLWNVEIRPIQITWCYINNGQLCKKKVTETRHRDKYLKVRVRYSGEDLALIQGIVTMFNESYA